MLHLGIKPVVSAQQVGLCQSFRAGYRQSSEIDLFASIVPVFFADRHLDYFQYITIY